ncbi:synovial sarcoma, X member B family member isoform X1 [Mus musculus]|uniref:synovial sarcoma, X member B family member isoform X1 n=1 Tax=Mus musculus TaxID=10090 RepID=UPI0003D74B92|nr:synovial sarcoma, X member B family member isoform X1 [Mus musculus]|eukprot:XP_006527711.1 PREDICTED: synovial sarcoma, X member B family member isoform X1 [Mus musculus]
MMKCTVPKNGDLNSLKGRNFGFVIEEDKMVSFQNNTNMETVSSCEKIPMEVLCEPKNICKAFQDISTYFSDEEWGKLTEWQKSAYVYMKRNYIRMTDLGVTVNQPVFMRGKDQDKQCLVEGIEVHDSNETGGIQVNVWSHRLRERKYRVIYSEISDPEEEEDDYY